jgi:tetratricopeptide (TPR) repeat protein
VQLIEAKSDKHLWAESYEKEIRETKDIFGTQSQIAQSIAAELKATITPEEKQLIEKIPTTNLSAFDLFYQARSEHMKFWMDNTNIDGLNKAMTLYRQALLYDSTYAQAYSGLAWGYMNKNSVQTNLKTNFVDSMIIYADKAFGYNDRLDEAFYVKGQYYNITGDYDKAFKEFSEAIKINPNFSWAYISRANLHYLKTHNIFSALDDNFKAIELEHGPLRLEMIKALVGAYWSMGFPENARYYLEETLKLDNDSISYLNGLANIEFLNYQNYTVSLDLSYRVLKKDPANLEALRNNLLCYLKLGKYEDAYHIAINILKIWNERDYSPQTGWEYLAYVFLKTGHTKEAKYYFDKQIKLGKEVLTLDPNDSNIKIVLAEVYAILGEKGKAFELLNISKDVNENHSIAESNIPSYSWLFMCKYNPAFENLCNDPIFQQYVNQLEADFNAGHEKLKAWLGEKGMQKE